MRWLLPATALACFAAAASPADAQPPLTELQQRAHADPHDAEAAYELALAYHAAHDLPAAIEQYRAAQLLDPTNSLIHTSLHTALEEQRLLQTSLAEFNTTFGQARAHPAAAFNLALAAERHGLIEEAIFHYRRYVSMAPAAPDAPAVALRVAAMEHAIGQREVRIHRLRTRPATVRPGERAHVQFAYRLEGWGKRNRTGVVERVSLYRDDVETHRFAQRSIRDSGKGYTARMEILVPPDAAPGAYTLRASAVAGSRRDEQIAVFTIAPPPVRVPPPIREEDLPLPPDTVLQVPPFPSAPAPTAPEPEPAEAAASPATGPATGPASREHAPERQTYPEDDAREAGESEDSAAE